MKLYDKALGGFHNYREEDCLSDIGGCQYFLAFCLAHAKKFCSPFCQCDKSWPPLPSHKSFCPSPLELKTSSSPAKGGIIFYEEGGRPFVTSYRQCFLVIPLTVVKKLVPPGKNCTEGTQKNSGPPFDLMKKFWSPFEPVKKNSYPL